MTTQATSNNGRYLYALVDSQEKTELPDGFSGLDGAAVCVIPHGRIAAVVSNVPNGKIRPERRNLAAHQKVLKQLSETGSVLPMAFGMVAAGPPAIRKILKQNQDALVEQLERVTGKVEMGLRVAWDVPNVFEYLVNAHPELKEARDGFFSGHGEPSRGDLIELGRMTDRILNEDRDTHTGAVEDVLSQYCFEMKRNKCRAEHEVMNLAFLVGRDARTQFETGILEAAKLFDDNFLFDYSGPWAPYNFVEMTIAL